MTAIGVFSDSQGDLDAFDVAVHLLRGKGARRFIFPGGRYADVDAWLERIRTAAEEDEELTWLKDRFLRTPERGSPEYQSPEIARKSMDMLGDVLCCVVHDRNDLDRDDMLNALVFVHGKDERPGVVQIGPRFFVTAGRVAGNDGTCGLFEVMDRTLQFSAFALDGRVVLEKQVLAVGGRTKLSVK